jgi:hypothetical protein
VVKRQKGTTRENHWNPLVGESVTSFGGYLGRQDIVSWRCGLPPLLRLFLEGMYVVVQCSTIQSKKLEAGAGLDSAR